MNDQIRQRPDRRRQRDPWLAVLLSKVLPGAGQIYGGETGRGLYFISLVIVLYAAVMIGIGAFLMTGDARDARAYALVVVAAMAALIAVAVYALFDSYRVTKRNHPGDSQAGGAGRRKAWLAAFLSAFIPGIGQFYNRQVLKGAALLTAWFVLGRLEKRFAVLFIAVLFIYVTGVRDAFDSAEKRNGSPDRFFGQERKVLLFLMIMFTLQALPYPKIIREYVVEAFTIPAVSMTPTLIVGDYFLLGKSKLFFPSLERGDVVVFPYPLDPRKKYIKRVIALGGDTVRIIHGTLYINGEAVPSRPVNVPQMDDEPNRETFRQPLIREERIDNATYEVQYLRDDSAMNGGPWQVPQDAVFVLGDNRDNSQDSRDWGTVPRATIEGKALKIYWSWDRETGTVRWERIGAEIH